MKKIIITGATGYIGSRLCKNLLQNNFKVGIIKRNTSNLNLISDFYHKIDSFDYDSSYESIDNVIKIFNPDLILHLASYQSLEHNTNELDSIINSNIVLGTYLIESMKNHNIRFFINTGTSWQNYNNENYNPVSLHAACKQAFIDIIKYYTENQIIKVITLKLFDTYGKNDPRKKIFYYINKAIKENSKLDLTGGKQMLNILHINDVIDAYAISINRIFQEREKAYEEYNVRSMHNISLKDLVYKYLEFTGANIEINWGAKPYRNREVMLPYDKGKILPGWSQNISIEDGLRELSDSLQ